MTKFGKSNIWLIRKIFQSQANIFILFTVWIIHQNGLNHPIFFLFEILKKIKVRMRRNDKIEDNLVTSNRWNDRSCVNTRLSEIEPFFSVKETGSRGLCNRRLAYLCSLVPTSLISSQSYELRTFFPKGSLNIRRIKLKTGTWIASLDIICTIFRIWEISASVSKALKAS